MRSSPNLLLLWDIDGTLLASGGAGMRALRTALAARFGIDALKATAPIWKRETWRGGDDWAKTAQHLTDLSTFVAERATR